MGQRQRRVFSRGRTRFKWPPFEKEIKMEDSLSLTVDAESEGGHRMGMPVHGGSSRFAPLRPLQLIPELDATTTVRSSNAAFRRMCCDGREPASMCVLGERRPLDVPNEEILATDRTNEATVMADTETLSNPFILVKDDILFLAKVELPHVFDLFRVFPGGARLACG